VSFRKPFAAFFIVWYCWDVVRDVLRRGRAPLAGKSVLEIGCGAGALLFRVAGKADHVTGLDVSETVIAFLREHYATRYPNIELIACDIARFRPKRTYDLVISNDCLEHVEDQEAFIASAARALSPDGAMCLQFPNHSDHGVRHHADLGSLRRLIRQGFSSARYFHVVAGRYHKFLDALFCRMRARASPRHERTRQDVLNDPRTRGLDDFARSACYEYMRQEVRGGPLCLAARIVNGIFRVADRLGPQHRIVELTDQPDDTALLGKRLVVLARGPVARDKRQRARE